jgi:HlyD family secretion protein
MKVSRKRLLFISALLLAALVVVYIAWKGNSRAKAGEFSGVVEAEEINVSPETTGRIIHLGVKEGDTVEEGQLLARLENRESEAALRQAEASVVTGRKALAEGVARLDALKDRQSALKEEIALNEAERERAKAVYEEAGKNLARIEKLRDEGYVSERDYDDAFTRSTEAGASLKAAEAGIRRAGANLREAVSETEAQRRETERLRAQIKEAEASADFFKARFEYTKIVSPVKGLITYRAFSEGETAHEGETIVTIIKPEDRWVRINLDESLAGGIRIGSELRVTAAGIDRAFRGRVFEIGREAEFATERDVTRGKQDIKTFRVKIRIEDPEGMLKPGMTAKVRVP